MEKLGEVVPALHRGLSAWLADPHSQEASVARHSARRVASEFQMICSEELSTGSRLPARLESDIKELGCALGHAAVAALKADAAPPTGSRSRHGSPRQQQAEHPAAIGYTERAELFYQICSTLAGWLALVERGIMQPSREDSVRALSAAAIPLKMGPPMLDSARGLYEALRFEQMGPELRSTMLDLLELTAQPVRQLLALAAAGPRSPLPPPAVALLQRAHLSASALAAYTLSASQAALALVRGGQALPPDTGRLLCYLFKQEASAPLLQQMVGRELGIVFRLAVEAFTSSELPASAQLGSAEAEQQLVSFQLSAHLLSARALREHRWCCQSLELFAEDTLLSRAVRTFSSQQLCDAGGIGSGGLAAARLRLSCMGLAAWLVRDACFTEHEGEDVPSFALRLIVHCLGCLMPMLCQLAAEVASASPHQPAAQAAPEPQASPPLAAATPAATPTATPAATPAVGQPAPAQVPPLAADVEPALPAAAPQEGPSAGGPEAASFGQLCWGQLAGDWAELLRDVAEMAGSLEAFHDFRPHTFREQQAVEVACAAQAMVRLLALLPLQPVPDASHTTVRGSSSSSGGNRIPTAAAVVAAAGGPTAVLQRYLEPGAKLTEAAVPVVLSKTLPTIADRLLERNDETCAWDEPSALAAFSTACRYAHLVGSMSTAAGSSGAGSGAGTGAAILAQPANKASSTFFDAFFLESVALGWIQPLFMQPADEAGGAEAAMQLQRKRERVLLLHLAALQAVPLSRIHGGSSTAKARGARSRQLEWLLNQQELAPLWRLLLRLRGKASAASLASQLLEGLPSNLLQLPFDSSDSSDSEPEEEEGPAFLLQQQQQQQRGRLQREQQQVDVPALERDLAVMAARALATRSCAHVRCANLAGASEAAVRGKRCSACAHVRYCSAACQLMDWPQHRVACRVLKQQRQQ